MAQGYFGFYWTLPVPWAGFTDVSPNVDEAATQSTTIRYQRDFVRAWVRGQGGELLAEEAHIESAPDRGSDELAKSVDRLLERCRKTGGLLVLVNFAEEFGWRRHKQLWGRLPGDLHVALSPAPIVQDGRRFDPIAHFQLWKKINRGYATAKPNRKAAAAEALIRLADEGLSVPAMADALNAEGLTTPTGKAWTADNLQKFKKSLPT